MSSPFMKISPRSPRTDAPASPMPPISIFLPIERDLKAACPPPDAHPDIQAPIPPVIAPDIAPLNAPSSKPSKKVLKLTSPVFTTLKTPPHNPPTAAPIRRPLAAANTTAITGPSAVPPVPIIIVIATTTITAVAINFQCSLHHSKELITMFFIASATPPQKSLKFCQRSARLSCLFSFFVFSHSGFK